MHFKYMVSCGVVLALGVMNLFNEQRAQGAPPKDTVKPDAKFMYAFFYGEAEADESAAPAGGFSLKRIQWMFGKADGSGLRTFEDLNKAGLIVAPVGRTFILEKNDSKVVLLGPQGKKLELSRKQGPLAEAKISDLDLSTVPFSFSPDGKTLAFVNEEGSYCRITLDTMQLTVFAGKGIRPYDGIAFSDDGQRIAYSRIIENEDRIFAADEEGKNEIELRKTPELKGFGFLPENRLGVVTNNAFTVYDATSGKEQHAVVWRDSLNIRSFGGFCPDGSAFIFDDGGPYHLNLFHMDIKTQKLKQIRELYLESFQRMGWVRVPIK